MGGQGSGRTGTPGRRHKAAELRARGLSLQEIGRRLGVSHQAIHQLLGGAGGAAVLPAVACSACGRALARRTRTGDSGPAYCRACLARRPDVPLPVRLRSLRLAGGLTQQALAQRVGWPYRRFAEIETGRSRNPGWPIIRPLIETLGVDLVPGRRLRFPKSAGTGPGLVACRDCGRPIARGAAAITSNGPVWCLSCLPGHAQAGFGPRLKAYRLAAGYTLDGLGERTGLPPQQVSGYECGAATPKWRTLSRLVEALGLGLVDVAGG